MGIHNTGFKLIGFCVATSIRTFHLNADPSGYRESALQIQLLNSLRIRIKGAKPMQFLVDPDPAQILPSQKVEF
jgi:hypothetical protein